MRKVESAMVDALRRGEGFRRDNTAVITYGDRSVVTLHGNRIGVVHYGPDGRPVSVDVRDAGWRTVTTKSRLNALLEGTGYRVFQSQWQWFVSYPGPDGDRVTAPWTGRLDGVAL